MTANHAHHHAWRRWRLTSLIALHLYMSGITGGFSTKWGAGCNGCLTHLRIGRGRRPYVLWVHSNTWRCILRGRHLPGDPIGFGLCSKCVPCPDCGSRTAGHTKECPA